MRISGRYDKGFMLFILVLASALGVATGIGKGWEKGLGSFAVVMGFWLVVPWLPWDRLELLQSRDKDERQGQLMLEAGAFTGVIMIFVALAGTMIDAAHGHDGPYSTMCIVGGASFLVACLVLPRVRR